jgi:hypothetical protein
MAKIKTKKLTCKKAKEFMLDETKSAKIYKSYGLCKFAKDEKHHSRFFKKVVKRCKK